MERPLDLPDIGRDGFTDAARRVLQFLREHFPMLNWQILRIGDRAAELDGREGDPQGARDADDGIAAAGERAGDLWDWELPQETSLIQRLTPLIVQPLWSGPEPRFGSLAGFPGPSGNETARPPEAWVKILADLLSALLEHQAQVASLLRAAEDARTEARTDFLTGLPNRRGWNERLRDAQCRRASSGGMARILAIDIDDLKRVNDTRGHLHGDELLRRAAEVLVTAATREGEWVARTGGDEFAVLSVGSDGHGLEELRRRFRDAFVAAGIGVAIGGASDELRNHECGGASGGASGEASGEATLDLMRLWADADADMCRQKSGCQGG